MDLMVKGDVVEESGLVPLPDGHCGPAEDAGHCVWLCEDVKHHLCISFEVKIQLILLEYFYFIKTY